MIFRISANPLADFSLHQPDNDYKDVAVKIESGPVRRINQIQGVIAERVYKSHEVNIPGDGIYQKIRQSIEKCPQQRL